MYTAEVRMDKEGTCTLQAPTLEAMFKLIFRLNENIFVNGVQVSAKDGKMPGVNGYFAGCTRDSLRAIYEKD